MDTQIISNFKLLCDTIDIFLKSDSQNTSFEISSKLRKPMRDLPNLYSNLYYFAYGVGLTYKLYLSKETFTIDFTTLTHSTKKLFITHSGLKISENITSTEIAILDPYLGLTKWFKLLSDCLLVLGGEKDFKSKHFDLEKKIWADLKKNITPTWSDLKVQAILPTFIPKPIKGVEIKARKNTSIYYPENN